MKHKTLPGLAVVLLYSLVHWSPANATLISRLDGLAYYHQELGISWLADASFARTSGASSNGQMTWDDAMAWTADLSIAGIEGWRLPDHDVNDDGVIVDCSAGGVIGCADNEMGYLYYEEGVTWATPGPFLNIQNEDYWGIEPFDASRDLDSWVFNLGQDGSQNPNFNNRLNFVWAVFDGDVGDATPTPVPEPGLLLLALSGLLGLGIARRARA